MQKLTVLIVALFWSIAAMGQMWNGTDTLYGNEWIDYSKTYIKIKIAQDGLYKVDIQTLESAGAPISGVAGQQFRLYREGKEERLFVSTDAIPGPQDYFLFYGKKNRGEVDAWLFEKPEEEQINPQYSIFNDTAVYFLCWATSPGGMRFTTEPNDLTNLPPASPYCWTTSFQMPITGTFKKKIGPEITYSLFDGVGYTAPSGVSETPLSFALPHLFAGGPDATVQVRYACNLNEHRKQIFINDSMYVEDMFTDFKVVDRNLAVSISQLGAAPKIWIHSPIGDRHGLSYVSVKYPRTFEFDGQSEVLFETNQSGSPQYFEIQGVNTISGDVFLWDLSAGKRWKMVEENGVLKVKTGAGIGDPGSFLLASEGAVKKVQNVQVVQFQPLTNPADYVIISNKSLFNDPVAGGANRVEEYAQYRSSSAGGGHQVKVVDVETLYDQFAYGVRFHPLAIRNFLHWGKRQWPGFGHALIIGKALDFNQFRDSTQQSGLVDSLFFVPNFSLPGADMPFAMQGNHLSTPIVAIGRLAVTKPSQIRDYLEKAKEYEAQASSTQQTVADKAWMKRVIHNSGGQSVETQVIRNFTSSMAETLKSGRFGADVHSFYKTSNDPVQLSAYEQLLDLVNSGVSIWTIFGHSSAFAVDFDIGLPTDYQNKGKYPFMMVMGCFSGICSTPQQGIGEQFVLSPNRGAIAYTASVNYSYIDALYTYGSKFYQRVGSNDYGKSIGQTLAGTIADLKGSSNASLLAVLHQNLLQGDPAVKLYAHQGPDYLIDNQSVVFDPNPVGIDRNFVKLSFDVVNIGENKSDSIAIAVDQRLPDQVTVLKRLVDTTEAPAFRKTLEYQVPLEESKVGFNRFFITLDPENRVTEAPSAAELNNALTDGAGAIGQELYVFADDISLVYPPDFAIVTKPSPVFYASTLNTRAAGYGYFFELDTLESFDSPLKWSNHSVQPGGLLRWQPTVTLRDSTVYYWRVARDSVVNGQLVWRMNSFIYLPGSPGGWNQSHFGQYRDNVFNGMTVLDSLRQIDFTDNAAFVNVQVAYRNVNRYPGFKNAYYQGFYGDYGWNQYNIYKGVALMVVNPNDGKALINPENGPYNFPPKKDRDFFWFDTSDSLKRAALMDFLDHGIPDGYYAGLLAFNTPTDPLGYAPHKWAADSITQGKNLFQVLESQGARKVRQLAVFNHAPPAYGLVFRKNHPEFPAQDTVVFDPDITASVRASFSARWAGGFFETPAIGPVKSWKSIIWSKGGFDDPSDFAALSVYGLQDGREDTLLFRLENIFDTLISDLSVAEFPRLKLRYETGDTLARTATPLRYARVTYEPLPEGALFPAGYEQWYKDTLQQGDVLKCGLAFVNVSDVPMDSTLARFKVDNQQHNGIVLTQPVPSLSPGDSIHLLFRTSTRYLEGLQRAVFEVNPENNPREQIHFNNVYLRDFVVLRDKKNPVLDVTFDGAHILDGDLVSPKPEVFITLKDENPFLAMRDSNSINLVLRYPDGREEALATGDPSIRFYPSDPTNLPKKNQVRIEWRPNFVQDGEYVLSVNGRDASGNESALLDWSARFKVITKSSISNLLNYPNPFSSSTCFVYTLTGSESPAHFKIQIMTVSGKVVREITEQEFGPLKPGVHRSDYCWDGTDTYGDRLANGVYLYRMVAKKADGTDFEHFDNQSVDGFFRHGWGKMVLIGR